MGKLEKILNPSDNEIPTETYRIQSLRIRKLIVFVTIFTALNYRYFASGIHLPLLCKLFTLRCPEWIVQGTVHPSYTAVSFNCDETDGIRFAIPI